VDDHNHFTKFLRVLDALNGAQSTNILLFVDNCATHPHDKLFLQNIYKLFTKLQKCDVFHKAWIQLDSEKGDNFRCKASVDNQLVTWGNSWVKSCATIVRVTAAVGRRKRGMNTILSQQWAKPKPVLLKLFLLCAGWCTSQTFLDLELVQFCLKSKVSN